MSNYLENLPIEILEYIHFLVHKSRYKIVMNSLVEKQYVKFEVNMIANAVVEEIFRHIIYN